MTILICFRTPDENIWYTFNKFSLEKLQHHGYRDSWAWAEKQCHYIILDIVVLSKSLFASVTVIDNFASFLSYSYRWGWIMCNWREYRINVRNSVTIITGGWCLHDDFENVNYYLDQKALRLCIIWTWFQRNVS